MTIRTKRQAKFAGALAGLFALLALTSCGGAASDSGAAAMPVAQHVAILVLENSKFTDIVGSPNMPYINSLIRQGGLATRYYANHHPSLPNYFVMTTGTSPTTTDSSPVFTEDNVVRELEIHGKSWRVYAENLPQQGYLGPDVDPFYFRSFDAFTYFSDVQPPSALNMNIVNYEQLAADLQAGQLPNYLFIIPDTEHNGHSCPGGGYDCGVGPKLASADAWLRENLPQLLESSQFQQSGLLLITTDEARMDDTDGGGRVATVIVGTGVKRGYAGTGLYDHRSLLSLSLKALGITTIPNDAGAANQMNEFFEK